MSPKISVIVAVYNTAPYLRRCLNSVCGQTLRDIEILCVNDASTDASLDILREYAARDSRIHVIDFSRNRGLSAVRNVAFATARGEYLGFVDSDDAVEPDFYEKLYAKAQETGALVVKGMLRMIAEDGVIRNMFLRENVQENKFAFTAQWTTAIYQTAFIRDNGINCCLDVYNGQDLSFLIKVVCLAPGIEAVHDAWYWYIRRAGSNDSAILSPEKIHGILNGLEDASAFINRHMSSQEEYTLLFWHCLAVCEYLVYRAHPEDHTTPVACAASALRIYCSSPYAPSPPKEREMLSRYLRAGDVDALAEYWRTTPVSPKNIHAAHLRSRLRHVR